MTGFVYLIEEIAHSDGDGGPWTKIGVSKNDPTWRLNANLKRGNPRTLRLAAAFFFPSEAAAYQAEKEAHDHFKAAYHQKEWFRLPWQEAAAWLATKEGASLVADKSS